MEYLYLDDDDLNPADIFNSIDKEREQRKCKCKNQLEYQNSFKRYQRYHKRPSPIKSAPRKRSVKKHSLEYIDDDGTLKRLTPTKTFWYCYYILSRRILSKRALKTFRKRFRLPHKQFLDLLAEIELAEHFTRWAKGSKDCYNEPASPLSLLLLGALRYLGRGWTFDDIEEATAINKETHRQFFHVFIGYGSTVLFSKYVITPTTAEEAKTYMHEMALAGFPGCPCSTDATHISMDRCSNSLRNLHKGPKLHLPARTYNLSSNHRRFILYTTSGHPSKWNDKTLQRFDGFMKGIRDGSLMGDVIFELDDKDKEGNDIKVKYKGAWQIVDNGYMPWSTCVPPLKHNCYSADQRWSWWVESMRKDVECTFGILKGRWRILKSPIQVHGVETVDMIWKTCCGLHNLLLEIDGRDEEWTSHIHSDSWTGTLGEFDEEPPFAIQHLKINQPSFAKFDFSGMGLGSDFNIGVDGCDDSALTACTGLNEINIHEINIVSQLSLDTFRRKLIKHFDIKYKRNEIVWPKQKPIVNKF